MDNKLTETIPTWVAPRLMRLNHAEGTDKHVLVTEGAGTGTPLPTECGGTATFSGGGDVCGPS